MCTVTYVPNGQQSFILTSSRDESILRERALPPEVHPLEHAHALFPKDSAKGGTWIGSATNQRSLCLLNGAFENHEPSDQYIKSRGIVVLDFFNATDINDFVNKYSFENVEPFTLIIIEHEDNRSLFEFRWDGNQKSLTELDASQHHIWSSSTLYNKKQANQKSNLFTEYLKQEITASKLFDLHENGIPSNAEVFKYHGIPQIKTLSITQLELTETEMRIHYKLLDTDTLVTNSLSKVNDLAS